MGAYGISNVPNIDSVQVLVVAGLLNKNLQNECRQDECGICRMVDRINNAEAAEDEKKKTKQTKRKKKTGLTWLFRL